MTLFIVHAYSYTTGVFLCVSLEAPGTSYPQTHTGTGLAGLPQRRGRGRLPHRRVAGFHGNTT